MIWFTKLAVKYENSNFYKKKLIKKYKPEISPGIKSVDEMLTSLKTHFDMVKADKKDVSKIFWKLCVSDVLNNSSNKDFDFCIYKIIANKKSQMLYDDLFDVNDEDIFVIFERTNDFFISNNHILQSMLIVERGISEADYNMNSDALISYLRVFKDCQINYRIYK